MTSTPSFNPAAQNQKAVNAFKAIISHMPDIDHEVRQILIATLDQTQGLSKHVVISFREHPELGEKIYEAVAQFNYGDYAEILENHLYKNKIQGDISAGLFTGTPQKSGSSTNFIHNSYEEFDAEESDRRKKIFTMLWYDVDAKKAGTKPNRFAIAIDLNELNHKDVELSPNIQRNNQSSWDRMVRDHGPKNG